MEDEHPHKGRCFRCGKEWPTRVCKECVTPPVPRVVALCVGVMPTWGAGTPMAMAKGGGDE